MLPKCVLPFKLETTRDTVTPRAGLVLFGEFLTAIGLPKQVQRLLPRPGSASGYEPVSFVLPVVLLLAGGGRTLEDLRQIREDAGLRRLLGLEELPSSDAMGDWLRRMGRGTKEGANEEDGGEAVQPKVEGEGLKALGEMMRWVRTWGLLREWRRDYTLDYDTSQIVAEKQEAKRTYKGETGYMPMVGHLAENGLLVLDEMREGNKSPSWRHEEFLKACDEAMPQGKRIRSVRSDSAGYQAEVMNYCVATGKDFTIGARLDGAVRAAIAAIPATAWRPCKEGRIAETVHCMERTKQAFRLIVVERAVQRGLFGETQEELEKRYKVIATNREGTAEEIVSFYNERGQYSENRIKELKLGFGMEYMPCGTFAANAVWFRLGALAYNLFVLFRTWVLPRWWRRHTVATVRWRLFAVAGKVVEHAGSVLLRVSRTFFGLLEEVRVRCWELAGSCVQ